MSDATTAITTPTEAPPKQTLRGPVITNTPKGEPTAPVDMANIATNALNARGYEKKTEEPIEENEEMTKAEAKEEIRRYKVKINGEEHDVDENELKRGYSHQKAANKEMQAAKALQKQAMGILEQLKDEGTLFQVMKQLGHDPRGLSEKYLSEIIKDEMLDPRDRELKEAKRKIQEYEDFKTKEKADVEERNGKEMQKRFSEDYTKQFTEALDKSELPVTKETISRMAHYIKLAAELDNYAMTADEASKLVQDDYTKKYRSVIANADGEQLMKLLGDDIANKVRKWDTSRVKDPNQFIKTPEKQGEKSERKTNKSAKPTNTSWQNYNRS